jgi:hypothetical protein
MRPNNVGFKHAAMDILYTGKLLNRNYGAGDLETEPTIGHSGYYVQTYFLLVKE